MTTTWQLTEYHQGETTLDLPFSDPATAVESAKWRVRGFLFDDLTDEAEAYEPTFQFCTDGVYRWEDQDTSSGFAVEVRMVPA